MVQIQPEGARQHWWKPAVHHEAKQNGNEMIMRMRETKDEELNGNNRDSRLFIGRQALVQQTND